MPPTHDARGRDRARSGDVNTAPGAASLGQIAMLTAFFRPRRKFSTTENRLDIL